MASIFGEPTFLHCSHTAMIPLSPALLDVIRQLHHRAIVHGAEYDTAPSVVAFRYLESSDWSAFASVNPSNVLWAWNDLAGGKATTHDFLLVQYVVLPILDFSAVSRRIEDYFGDKESVSGPFPGTEDTVSVIALSEPGMAPADLTSPSFSLDPPLLSSPLPTSTLLSVSFSLPSSPRPTLSQPRMTGSSPHVSTFAPASVFFFFRCSSHDSRCACLFRCRTFVRCRSRLCWPWRWPLVWRWWCHGWTIVVFLSSCPSHFPSSVCGHAIGWVVTWWCQYRWCSGYWYPFLSIGRCETSTWRRPTGACICLTRASSTQRREWRVLSRFGSLPRSLLWVAFAFAGAGVPAWR